MRRLPASIFGAGERETMNVTTPNLSPDQQRQRARALRTVWILAVCAIASYALFFYSATHQ
jgi:hypothetical protein